MTADGNDQFSFACPTCNKKLKAPAKASGRIVRCPKCKAQFKVPNSTSTPIPTADEDPFSLKAPAITDRADREHEAAALRAQQELAKQDARIGTLRRRRDRDSDTDRPIPFDSLDKPEPEATTNPASGDSKSGKGKQPVGVGDTGGEQSTAPTPKRSVFDDDLPELEQLAEITAAHVNESEVRRSPPNSSAARKKTNPTDDLEDLLPDLGSSAPLPPLVDETEEVEETDYRIICKTCGTAQWVNLSMKGKKMKCPDCFIEFRVPPPPDSEKAKRSKKKIQLDDEHVPLAPASVSSASRDGDASRRERTRQMLEKAQQEISDEDIERLYDTDFDTADFVHRTFGFLKSPINISQILIYGIIFSMLFGVAQYGANNTDGFFGRGMLLIAMILVPLVAILFTLPMLSGGLALIEAVANKERVDEFPAFNMFDNVGEVILITVALAAAIVPGFLVGMAFAGSEGGFLLRLSAMMLTSFALFPLFLLSMLDNNSIFQPISGHVLQSVKDAAEAWGGYYLKTLVGFFIMMLAWIFLLGGSPVLAAIAGFLLPLFVFFICQQVGALADAISEHLSFELAHHDSRENDDEDE